MMRLFRFDNLITPGLIRFFFFFLVVIHCLGAVVLMISVLMTPAFLMGAGLKFLSLIGIVVGLVVAIVLYRIAAEMTLVIFMIRDELAWQRLNAAPESSLHLAPTI
jgi:hypothetical protein